jgi:hypothetical protein
VCLPLAYLLAVRMVEDGFDDLLLPSGLLALYVLDYWSATATDAVVIVLALRLAATMLVGPMLPMFLI